MHINENFKKQQSMLNSGNTKEIIISLLLNISKNVQFLRLVIVQIHISFLKDNLK